MTFTMHNGFQLWVLLYEVDWVSAFEIPGEGDAVQTLTRIHTRSGEVFDVIEPFEQVAGALAASQLSGTIELKSDG